MDDGSDDDLNSHLHLTSSQVSGDLQDMLEEKPSSLQSVESVVNPEKVWEEDLLSGLGSGPLSPQGSEAPGRYVHWGTGLPDFSCYLVVRLTLSCNAKIELQALFSY